jgi:hypothetical protein
MPTSCAQRFAEGRLLRKHDGGDKAAASSGDRGEISTAGLTVRQRWPQRRNMDLKIALLDHGAGPDAGHELFCLGPPL